MVQPQELIRYVWAYHRVADRHGKRGGRYSDALASLRLGTYHSVGPSWSTVGRNVNGHGFVGGVLWLGTGYLGKLLERGRKEGLEPLRNAKNVFAPQKNVVEKLTTFVGSDSHARLRCSFASEFAKSADDVVALRQFFNCTPAHLRFLGDVLIGTNFPEFCICIGLARAEKLWDRSPAERAAHLLLPIRSIPRAPRPDWLHADENFTRVKARDAIANPTIRLALLLGAAEMNGYTGTPNGEWRAPSGSPAAFVVLRTAEETLDLSVNAAPYTLSADWIVQAPVSLLKSVSAEARRLQVRSGRAMQVNVASDRLLKSYAEISPWLWSVPHDGDELPVLTSRSAISRLIGLVLIEIWAAIVGECVIEKVVIDCARGLAVVGIREILAELGGSGLIDIEGGEIRRRYRGFGSALQAHASYARFDARVRRWAMINLDKLPEPMRERTLRVLTKSERNPNRFYRRLYDEYGDVEAGAWIASELAIKEPVPAEELWNELAARPETRERVRDAEFRHLLTRVHWQNFFEAWVNTASRHPDAIRILPRTMQTYAEGMYRLDRVKMAEWWIEQQRDPIELVDALVKWATNFQRRELSLALQSLRSLEDRSGEHLRRLVRSAIAAVAPEIQPS